MTDHFHACERCGQTVITRADPPLCAVCRAILERPAQHSQAALFTPVQAMPGQTTLGGL